MGLQAAEQGKYGISSTTLGNGMDVIVIENHALPLVTIEIAVKNGAYTEPPEFDGLSHLYEHMFFKGNGVIPNQERYMERVRELGARWNGTTSDELVNYFMTVHKKNMREASAFLRDALLYPLFLEEELRREWPVVLGEFDRSEAQPSFHLRREINRRLWSKHYSRKNTIGDRDVIFNATREQMRTIQGRYYIPNNSALIIGGDVNPDEVFEMAEDLFGDWERGDDPDEKYPIPAHPPLEATTRLAVVGNVRTATINIAWHGPSMRDDVESTFAADVLAYILAQPDSNFHKALVDSGLVDGAGLSYYSLVHTGPINLTASTSADRLDNAWSAIEAELEKLDDPSYVTDDQIEAAKNMLEIGEIFAREQTSEFCHTIAFWWATGGLDYYLDYVENLRGVTRDDLARYVRTYIKGKRRIEAVLVNEEALEKIKFADSAEVIRPASGTSGAAFDQPADSMDITTGEFEVDGLKVVLRRNPLSEVVVAAMVLVGGVPYYGVENTGRELLLLETLDKGSRDYTKEELNRQLSRTGASLFSDARHDYSTFGLVTLERNLEENFSVFADAIAHPLLEEREVELAVERRLSRIRMQEQVPDAFISILGSRNFYRGHPYEVPPAGTEESIEGVTAADLEMIHENSLIRERMKLFVVGNVEQDELGALVRRTLKDVPHGEFERHKVMRDSDQPPRILIEERAIPTSYVWGSFEAPSFADADFPAFQVAISILSDRFFEEIRTKRNLSYAVSAQISSRASNYGVLYVTTVKPDESIRVMFDEIDRLIDEPVSDKELRDKIEQTITGDLMGNQSGQSQVNRLILYDVNGSGWQAEAEALDLMRGVTSRQIQEVAARYLKNFQFAILGNPDAIDRELLNSR